MVNNSHETKGRILEHLRKTETPISGASLGDELGISRVAIWKHLETLRNLGYSVKADHSGYLLLDEKDFLYPWEFPGREKRIVFHENTESTMDCARDLVLRHPGSFPIVVAETQKAGRGKNGRKWLSPSGGLFFTLTSRKNVKPYLTGTELDRALEVLCASMCELSGEQFTIKKPNDILLDGKKVAGILLEYLVEGDNLIFLNLGIGVNVANQPILGKTCSLAQLTKKISRKSLLESFLDHFELPAQLSASTKQKELL